jgi:hypothetical protein
MCCMQNYPGLILKTLRFALLATCLVCLAAMASPATPQAQQPAPAPENNKPAISLRVTTRLVQVNVVVNDKNGRPILGLDKGSFTLLDDKKAQRIEIISSLKEAKSNAVCFALLSMPARQHSLMLNSLILLTV